MNCVEVSLSHEVLLSTSTIILPVKIERTSRNKTLFANLTDVRLLSCMSSDVDSQRRALIETFTTIFARVRPFPVVHSFMHDQVLFLDETFGTIRTHVRLYTRVYPVMDLQFVISREPLSTNVTQQFFLPWNSVILMAVLHVLLQCGIFSEDPHADAALVVLQSTLDVDNMVSHLVCEEIL